MPQPDLKRFLDDPKKRALDARDKALGKQQQEPAPSEQSRIPCQVDWGPLQSLVDDLADSKNPYLQLDRWDVPAGSVWRFLIHISSEVQDLWAINECVLNDLEEAGIRPAIREALRKLERKEPFKQEADFLLEVNKLLGPDAESSAKTILALANVGAQCRRIRRRINRIQKDIELTAVSREGGKLVSKSGENVRQFIVYEKKAKETEPGVFVKGEFADELDAGNVSDELQKALSGINKALRVPIQVIVLEPGRTWRLEDRDRTLTAHLDKSGIRIRDVFVATEFSGELDAGNVSEELRNALAKIHKNLEAPIRVTVLERGRTWRLEGKLGILYARLEEPGIRILEAARPRIHYEASEYDEPQDQRLESNTKEDLDGLRRIAGGFVRDIEKILLISYKLAREQAQEDKLEATRVRALEARETDPKRKLARGRVADNLEKSANDAEKDAAQFASWYSDSAGSFKTIRDWIEKWEPEPLVEGFPEYPGLFEKGNVNISRVDFGADVLTDIVDPAGKEHYCTVPELKVHFPVDRPDEKNDMRQPVALAGGSDVLSKPEEFTSAKQQLADLNRRSLVPLKLGFQGYADRAFRGRDAKERITHNQALSERRAEWLRERLIADLPKIFRINDAVLEKLKATGVPACARDRLACIRRRVFSPEDPIQKVLEAVLGRKLAERYKGVIVAHAVATIFTEIGNASGFGDSQASGPDDNPEERYVRILVEPADFAPKGN